MLSLFIPTRRLLATTLIIFFTFPQFVLSGQKIQQLENLKLHIPEDITVSIFAKDVNGARHMIFDDQGVLFLSQTQEGKVIALPDIDRDGKADQKIIIGKGYRAPHGLSFAVIKNDYYLYIAEETKVIRLKRLQKPFIYGNPETIVNGIPGGGHYTRTIKIKDNKLYLSVGSSCNVCIERNPFRAAISRFNLDGSGSEIFAKGLRNSVGIEFSPYSGELWGINNGRDMLGDNHPKEELNIIRQGKHYGWPYCYESQIFDKNFGKPFDCSKSDLPAYTFVAHMAPLGLAFYQDGTLPQHYNNSLFISFHGSWNRSVPAGYKVIRLKLNSKGKIISHENFITGWLLESGSPTGRPVDLEQSPQGELYLSDDFKGVVYKISTYKG